MEFDTHFQIKKNQTENDFLGNFKVIFWGTKCLKIIQNVSFDVHIQF